MRKVGLVALSYVFFLACILPAVAQSAADRQQKINEHNRQATEFLRENQLNRAISELKAVIALDPHNGDALGNLGAILFFQGDYANAAPQLRAALRLKPKLWKIQALLGICEKRTGDLAAGQRDLERAFPKVQEKKIRLETGLELVEVYSGAGELEKAAATMAELRKVDPTNEVVLYSAYRIYSDLAMESVLSLSFIDPNSARMHQVLAHELAKRGDSAAAIENYRAAIKLDPTLPGIHFELAEMLNTQDSEEARQEAEKEYRTALQINPLDEQSECRLGEIALRRSDTKEANEYFSRALQLRPNDPDANIGVAKVFMTMDEPLKAEPLLQHALALDPTSALAHFRLGTVYRQTGRIDAAKHELDEYRKYKEMKEKLRAIYHDLHDQHGVDEDTDGTAQK